MATQDLATDRRFTQIEFDVESMRSALIANVQDTSRLRSRVDWLLILSIFGSTASIILSLVVFVLLVSRFGGA